MGNSQTRELEPPPELVLHILHFCSWEDRRSIFSLNRYFRGLLQSQSTWRWLCDRLEREHLIYVPTVSLNGQWKESFLHLYPFTRTRTLQGSATPDSDDEDRRNFIVKVFARFREGSSGTEEEAAAKATIPLHQRLAMLRAQHQCSPSEAFRLLWSRNGNTQIDPWEDAFVPDNDENAQTDNKENNEQSRSPKKPAAAVTDAHARVGILSLRPQQVVACAPSLGVRTFKFEHVFTPASQQADVYNSCARYLVADFINGINGCIFSYGQTGSGKTYTMFGPNDDVGASMAITAASGVAPRVLADILQATHERRHIFECTLSIAYVEVFGNELNDLLRDGAAIGAWHGVAVRHVMEGLASVDVSTPADVEALLQRAERAKRRAATAMNERSSRAHSVLIVNLHQVHRQTNRTTVSRLCIADLGGSEQIKKSRVSGDQLVEAVNINLGLLALKTCMTALRRRKTHVPFNDSVLTMLLEDSLAGSSNTVVVVTGNMHPSHCAETVNALRFGETCGRVEREGIVETTTASDAIDAINQELTELENQIRTLERWETRVVVRKDLEGEERVTVTVPVGAEAPRLRYEALLAARQELLGF